MPRQRPRFKATAFIKFAKMRHRLLDDAPTDAHASYQPPVAVDLPILPPNRVA